MRVITPRLELGLRLGLGLHEGVALELLCNGSMKRNATIVKL